ncbi:MAG TPA: sigma-54-dependent Fis family transcriptional regulator [Anaeromyxobacteraceae bacterium]|jgi:transcriptional regulator of acetoin/glycerol metabolism|nr:sigma-54-dependent Fis family transcriptional regulator [Anaeromyxobacteraceae bacterium]
MAEVEARDQLARRRFLDRAWLSFIGDGVEIEGLSPDLARAWRLARESYGIDPGLRRCTRLLPGEELARRREEDELFRFAVPVLQDFTGRLAPCGQVLAYFDAAGWMLSVDGDRRVVEEVADINFCAGANWREESAGTNGPGTALREKRPIEIFASAHYVEAWQSLSCAAAPVLRPGTAEVVGVVDITGPWRMHDVQAIVAARAIAFTLEERLRSVQTVRDQVVAFAFRAARGSGDALLAVDPRGRLLATNDAARRRLALEGTQLPISLQEAVVAALRAARAEEEIPLAWPGADGARLLLEPVRYDRAAAGAVVRLVSPGAPARSRTAPPRSAAVARYDFGQILGDSAAIREAISLARVASRNELPVLLCGESGTGKELFAQAIHSASARGDGPFIALNCGAIPAALAESELFGYEAGTFTGARREGKAGKFEEANGGTVFLDEVSELPPQAQTALLRVLQEREVVRLGGSVPRPLDVRVLAATNRPLAAEIRAGRFREDLYYRLDVLSVPVPPLRARPGDVPALAAAFLEEAARQVGRSGLRLGAAALAALQRHAWPGNVRELRNLLLRAAATAGGDEIGPGDLPAELRGGTAAPPREAEGARSLAGEPERAALVQALEGAGWNVALAAKTLRVSRMTLYRKLRRFGLARSATP